METVVIIWLFTLGAIFGSFGGVLISRKWDKKWIKDIFFGRSKCDFCHKKLWFLELVPIVSFLTQRARCKKCGKKLSSFYLWIEILSGVVFVLTYIFLPDVVLWELLAWIFINWWLLLLLVFDIQKYELHIPMWIFVTLIAVVFAFFKLDSLVVAETMIAYFLVFLAIYLFSKYYMRLRFSKKEEWFGQWDVFLSITIWALSWFVFYYNFLQFGVVNLINLILIYVILSCLIWLLFALISKIIWSKQTKIIPFLPSMILAFWLVMLFGGVFINILA